MYDIIEILVFKMGKDEYFLEGGKLICLILFSNGVGYIYSFCIIENYIVVFEVLLVLNLWEVYVYWLKESGVVDWFQWIENECGRFYVVDRKKGIYVGIFIVDLFFMFYQVNVFERDGNIYVDICCFYDYIIIKQIYLYNM